MRNTRTAVSIAVAITCLVSGGTASAEPLYNGAYGTPSAYTANYRGYGGGYTANYFPRGFSSDIPGSAAADPTYYQPTAPAVVQPAPALPPPPTTYAPQAAPTPDYQGGCNSCQSQAYNYRPPAYQTTTMRVPVTVYRPVTAYSPVSGAPVTSYQPCTTYRYQARRVPVWNFPILSWLFGWRRPVYTQPPVVANYGATNYGACSPVTQYPGAVSSTPTVIESSEGWQPTSPAPMTPQAMPSYPPAGTSGGGGVYAPQGTSNGGADADRRPALRPEYETNGENNGETREGNGDTELNEAGGESSYRAPIRRPYVPQPAKPITSGYQPRPTEPATESSPRVRLQMIPDPDAAPATDDDPDAPQLIDPRDRTARHARWGVVPASWPIAERPQPRTQSPRTQSPRAAAPRTAPQAEQWDTSGWEPMRKSW